MLIEPASIRPCAELKNGAFTNHTVYVQSENTGLFLKQSTTFMKSHMLRTLHTIIGQMFLSPIGWRMQILVFLNANCMATGNTPHYRK